MIAVWQQMFLKVLVCCKLLARNMYSFPQHHQAIMHLNLRFGFEHRFLVPTSDAKNADYIIVIIFIVIIFIIVIIIIIIDIILLL